MRVNVHRRVPAVALLPVLALMACETGGAADAFVIAGPTVPSPTPTRTPYVWDTDDELRIWVDNPVTRGPVPISLAGSGSEALIRIEPRAGVDGWVLRGPDLVPPATGIRTLRIWYRWRLDPSVPTGAVQTFSLIAALDVVQPASPAQQPTAYATLSPVSDWTAADFTPGSFRGLVDVRYVYLHQSSSNRGVFEINRLELVH